MTKKKINKSIDISDKNFKKLSIQVSLNGLSFCVTDTVTQKIEIIKYQYFENETNPIYLKDSLELLLKKNNIHNLSFDEVLVIHTNALFSLVPKALFHEENLSDYIKLNAKTLTTDLFTFDELEGDELVVTYVPFMNINNYIYDLFGEFTYMHNSTIILQYLLENQSTEQQPICYVHVGRKQMDITILKQRKLILYNSFSFETEEDFIYYLLFVLEQLEMDTASIYVRLYGSIEEDDTIYGLCYKYIKHISIFIPKSTQLALFGQNTPQLIDFSTL